MGDSAAQQTRRKNMNSTSSLHPKAYTLGNKKDHEETDIVPSDIGITGLKIVLDPGVSRLRRCCWATVLVASAALTFFQGLNRFQNFENRPVTVSVRIKPNDSLPFPDITVCPQMSSNRNLLNPKRLEILWKKTFPNKPFPTRDKPILDQLGFQGTLEQFLGYNTRVDEIPTNTDGNSKVLGNESQDDSAADSQQVCSGIEEDLPSKNRSLFWTKNQRSMIVASALLAEALGATKLWNSSSYVDEHVFDDCHIGKAIHCRERGRVEPIMTVNGKCMTFRADRVEQGGMYYGLKMLLNTRNVTGADPKTFIGVQENPPFAWSVLLHGRRQSPETAAFTHGYYVDAFGTEKAIAATLRTFKAQNIPRKPCEENPSAQVDVCSVRSYESVVAKLAKCRLPFMTEFVRYNECRSKLDYARATIIAIDVLEGNIPTGKGGRLEWRTKDNVCPQPCYRELFEMHSDTSTYQSSSGSLVKVYFPDMNFEEIVEETNYGIIPLLCDFGGTLGLLMGASVLTMVEILEAATAKLLGCLCKREIQHGDKGKKPPSSRLNVTLTADAFYQKRAMAQSMVSGIEPRGMKLK